METFDNQSTSRVERLSDHVIEYLDTRWDLIVLSMTQNAVLGTHLSEFHSGYRIYSTAALRQIPFERNSNDFHFGKMRACGPRESSVLPDIPATRFYFVRR